MVLIRGMTRSFHFCSERIPLLATWKEKGVEGKQEDKLAGYYTLQVRNEVALDQSDSCGGGRYGIC